jgi:hypothetical protein
MTRPRRPDWSLLRCWLCDTSPPQPFCTHMNATYSIGRPQHPTEGDRK